ncbi:MAG: proline dehydrogenase family protein [Acidobacteriota bacterium]
MSLFDRLLVATLPLVPRPIVRRVAQRYVAGDTLDEAVDAVRALNGDGATATLDLLGEEVTHAAQADEAEAEYLRILDAIGREGLDATVSIKATQFGLHLDADACRGRLDRVVRDARERDLRVCLDMEDRSTTDAILELHRDLLAQYGNVGTVLQAYMRRTLDDVAALPDAALDIRLCKGIYVEPRATAWKGYDTVRHTFVAALEKLLRRGAYVGIATHDEYLVARAVTLIDQLDVPRDRYEFQMLLGVDSELRRILLDAGHPLRVYVPYGRDWYPYSIRRLRENPAIAGHVFRAVIRREPA